jgi:hypothetical protein
MSFWDSVFVYLRLALLSGLGGFYFEDVLTMACICWMYMICSAATVEILYIYECCFFGFG